MSREQARSPSAGATDAEARRAFEAGRDAYERGEFDQALRWFEQAHALRPSPELLYNVGRAADSDGQASRAVAAYSSYLATYPQEENRDFVRARLEKMRALERAGAPTPASVGEPSTATTAGIPTVAQAEGRSRSEPGVSTPFAQHQPRRDMGERSGRPVWKRAWFWTAVGAVVVGGGVAAVLATRPRDPERARADAYVFTPEAQQP